MQTLSKKVINPNFNPYIRKTSLGILLTTEKILDIFKADVMSPELEYKKSGLLLLHDTSTDMEIILSCGFPKKKEKELRRETAEQLEYIINRFGLAEFI